MFVSTASLDKSAKLWALERVESTSMTDQDGAGPEWFHREHGGKVPRQEDTRPPNQAITGMFKIQILHIYVKRII